MPRIIKSKDKKGKKPEPSKRKARPDDDSSVDSKGNIDGLIEYSEEEFEDETTTPESSWDSSDTETVKPRRKAAVKAEKKIKKLKEAEPVKEKTKIKTKVKNKAKTKEETEDEDEDEDEDDEEEDDEEDDEEDEEEDEDEDDSGKGGQIQLLISDFGGDMGPPKPKKYKLKSESEAVRRFVKLVQSDEPDEDDIDRDIGYFKGLSPGSQDRLLNKLQLKIEPAEPTVPLRFQILAKDVPPEVERVALSKFSAMQTIDPSSPEYYKASQWINGYTRLPLGIYKDLPVKLEDGNEACQVFVTNVRKSMDDAIYGHDEAKLQILQFVSSWISNPGGAGNVLSIHGPPGVGKTTLVKDGVAKALGRPFHFITLGGATDSSYLDGHSYTYEGSVWGRIVDILIKSKCMNPIIYFDELDKVSETPKGEEINNLLIHLTDGSQNDRFQDKYFTGIDLNLSRCLFIFSHNNNDKVNPILRDRMYTIQVDGFNLKEKLVIAEQYLVQSALKEVNLFEKISLSKEILTQIIESFTGDEKGVRELKRCIQTIVSKMNMLRFYNDPAKVPFAIKGFSLPFILKKEHVELFLKKKAMLDASIAHLYT
jgi:flagellar biosynthesis GTPase FlhF